jgi:hypothetical protein
MAFYQRKRSGGAEITIDVKNVFTFFIFPTFFTFFNVFIFAKVFYYKKRWQNKNTDFMKPAE